MTIAPWPCIHCTADGCRQKQTPIPLPFAMPEQSTSHSEAWPTDNNWLFVACPECRRVSPHVGFHPVQQDRSEPPGDKLWLRISFRCAVEGCNTPVQFHVLVDPTITETTRSEWHEKLGTGYWKGVSPCGHPIAITSDQKVLFDRPGGTLQGYNPHHRMWLTF
jgi:hypothetical protein